MKTKIMIALALGALIAFFCSCGQAPATPNLGTGVSFTVANPVPTFGATPTPTPSPTPTPQTFTVLKNWGWRGEEMPLDFRTFQLAQNTGYLLWYQYEAGQFGVNGREYRRCRAKFILNGTEDSGTLTISDSEIVWSIDTTESVFFHPCPTNLDGTYNYSVDANGMTLDGALYPEVL